MRFVEVDVATVVMLAVFFCCAVCRGSQAWHTRACTPIMFVVVGVVSVPASDGRDLCHKTVEMAAISMAIAADSPPMTHTHTHTHTHDTHRPCFAFRFLGLVVQIFISIFISIF